MVNEIEFRNGGKCGRKIDVSYTNGKAESGKAETGAGARIAGWALLRGGGIANITLRSSERSERLRLIFEPR
jgi:hypothetical protein